MAGRCSTGAFGHNLGTSLALRTVTTDEAEIGNALEVEILGERFPAKVIAGSHWDTENERLLG